ncbi:hypothetical protein [Kineococcus rubinsiae]|uniref:hypothetical protein n=1 Tax=Kineococcus rubinsiae TaxID=2609562 RepID=UPI0014315A60|nr:hypothetical protein [Kineococcus rubinsiae]NIZ90308.1 hypothetical protein [Kineococcus rubinsiae]
MSSAQQSTNRAQERSLRVERTYRRWLRLYPGPFRHEHGEEALSTLLDTAGDPPRVRAQEVLALVNGALRARAQIGLSQRPSTLLEGLRWAMVLLLASSMSGHIWFLLAGARGDISTTPVLTGLGVASLVSALAGFLLVMRGKVTAAAVMAALNLLTVMANNLVNSGPGETISRYGVVNPWLDNLGLPVFALLLVAAVAVASSRSGVAAVAAATRPWRWRFSWLVMAVAGLGGVLQATAPNSPQDTAVALAPLIALALLVLASIVDGRAALAAAVVLSRQALLTASWQSPTFMSILFLLAVLLLVRALRRGRRSVGAAAH